ncbi:unnamed protein product [Ambrosiozyma monospora]|uniref:Unnamed protein product n=1 Tax=Ambrosiozyma monospora TaxID=43982 RepID=A0A9W7DEM8_AMBMO|nr:unnamed protein product [Ambrosiozyma monospora]
MGCNFTKLIKLDNLIVNSEIDFQSLRTLPQSLVHLTISSHPPVSADAVKSKPIKLPKSLKNLNIVTLDWLKYFDFKHCSQFEELKVSDTTIDHSSFRGTSENSPLWDRLPSVLSRLVISDANGSFAQPLGGQKVFGISLPNYVLHRKLQIVLQLSYKPLICVDASSGSDDLKWTAEFQNLDIPYCVIKNVSKDSQIVVDSIVPSSETTSNLPISSQSVVFREEFASKVSVTNSVISSDKRLPSVPGYSIQGFRKISTVQGFTLFEN